MTIRIKYTITNKTPKHTLSFHNANVKKIDVGQTADDTRRNQLILLINIETLTLLNLDK